MRSFCKSEGGLQPLHMECVGLVTWQELHQHRSSSSFVESQQQPSTRKLKIFHHKPGHSFSRSKECDAAAYQLNAPLSTIAVRNASALCHQGFVEQRQ